MTIGATLPAIEISVIINFKNIEMEQELNLFIKIFDDSLI